MPTSDLEAVVWRENAWEKHYHSTIILLSAQHTSMPYDSLLQDKSLQALTASVEVSNLSSCIV